ncbi:MULTISPECIES: hypothetical protein, partial [Bradyrhizobium]|uniref:hypothetical protein n=1 Tax=Bradyrhizobium TaxID=374 RepID=UPI001EDC12F1
NGWATSNRNGGRDHLGILGDIDRNPHVPVRHIVSQLIPFTKIVIRHYDPVASIIADAAESARPNSVTVIIRCSGPSIAIACKMISASSCRHYATKTSPGQLRRLPIATRDLKLSP